MELLLESFFRRVRDCPHDLAVESRAEASRLSFGELDARSSEWMRRLDGDPRPLAVAVGNRTAFLEIFLAAWRLGIPAVSMDASGTAAERRGLCRSLGIARLAESPRPVAINDSVKTDVELSTLDVEAAEPPPRTALVKLTSGSTGEPLAACFDAAALRAGIRQIGDGMDIDAGDRVLLALPLSHSYGFDNGLLSLLVLGTPLFLEPSVFPADLVRGLERTQATVLPLAPPLVRSLSAARWPEKTSLRRPLCAGGVLPEASARGFHLASGVPVHNFYGSTETGGICFERDPADPQAPGSVGQPLPGVELLFDGDGRVSVRSRANLIGRWRYPTAVPGVESAAEPSTVRTGDLGQLGADGRLRLTGRVADLLNIGGRKIAAVQVESALRDLGGVRDAAVVGVPDEARGERSIAFVVADGWPLDLRSVPSRLRPRELHRVDRLPYSARGKLDRHALRARALADHADGLVANFGVP
ncbi:MAG: class I adenylate-forming enzyme family protein [Acidobacteriota bacterium]